MSQIEDIIANAWDAEEAAQMGEPSPWKVEVDLLDPEWISERHACAAAVLDALEAAGFVVVPKEPTAQMCDAGSALDTVPPITTSQAETCFRAMLAAVGEAR